MGVLQTKPWFGEKAVERLYSVPMFIIFKFNNKKCHECHRADLRKYKPKESVKFQFRFQK